MTKPIIGFLGVGKLGLPLAVSIAMKGHKVLAYDVNPGLMKKQIWPHRETGPDGTGDFQPYLDSADITFCPLKEVVQGSDIIFLCVQTPHGAEYEGITRLPFSRADFDYKYLREVAQQVSEYVTPQQAVSVISTVLPGTMRREVLPFLPEAVYNPAFPAMGTVMRDFLEPEFILLGGTPGPSVTKLKDFYFHLLNRFCTVISIESAELSKCAYNTFVSMKVTVTNMLAEVAHKIPGCNIDEVSRVLTSATRRVCSPAYMQGGMGDGGACLAKGTLVRVRDGWKVIEQIQPGEWVLGLNEKTNEPAWNCVEKAICKGKQQVLRVKFDDTEVKATPDHKFFVSLGAAPHNWMKLEDTITRKNVGGQYVEGHRFLGIRLLDERPFLIESCSMKNDVTAEVWDLYNACPHHNFYANGILVSNCHPRDNIAMSWLAEKLKLSSNLFDKVMEAREWQTEWLADLFCTHGKDMPKYLLGKAYKADSAIVAGSASVLLANILYERQIDFAHWDPYIDIDDEDEVGEFPVKNPFAEEKACFFIGTQHSIFREYKYAPGSVILDPFRYIPEQPGVKIIPIGVGR
jgi:nucleotide sugar dehydrogenase